MDDPERSADAARDESTVSWAELLSETTSLVGDAQHARWICETATSTSRDEFVEMLDEPAGERAVAHLDAMVARARAGEPIQYVLGRWGFRRIDLAVDRRVLIPRPETELVAEVAIDRARRFGPTRRVLDLGTGSGAIGLAMADELPFDGTSVWLSDVSVDALAVARANLAGIGRHGANVRLVEGAWFDAVPAEQRFDVIVSNPPYVADSSQELEATVSEWEPHDALFAGPDGLDDIRRIVAGAPAHLGAGGWLVLEHGHDQGRAVADLMRAAGFTDIDTLTDLAGLDRLAVGRTQPEIKETMR